MNDLIVEYSKIRINYFVKLNPEYGKEYSIEDIYKPSEEDFGWHIGDYMTLGRPIPEYEDWATRHVDAELKRKQEGAKCPLMIEKKASSSLQEMEEFYNANKSVITRFVDPRLNEYFGVKIES